MQGANGTVRKPKVIVRAWGDEPVVLFLHTIDNTSAYVGQENSGPVIGLPLGQVFLFDEIAFATLKDAFDSGDTNKLVSTYSELSVNSPCNRYQDVLESQHDKEHITDSRSSASGRE